MNRHLAAAIKADLKEKMVFLGGPRQVGKTTLALSLLENGTEKHPAYLNCDDVAARKALLRGELPLGEPLVILDDIHKYGSSAESVGGLPYFLSMYDRRSGWIKRNQVRVSLRVRSSVGLSVLFSLVPRSRRRSRSPDRAGAGYRTTTTATTTEDDETPVDGYFANTSSNTYTPT